MRFVACVVAVALLLAPASALDWTTSPAYGELKDRCREAIERAAIWWTTEDLREERLHYDLRVSTFREAYPLMFVAERAGLLPSEVPMGVPGVPPSDEMDRVRMCLTLHTLAVCSPDECPDVILHETVYQRLAPFFVRDEVRSYLLRLVESQNEDGSWGMFSEEWLERTNSAVELLLRVLQFEDIVSDQLGLSERDFSRIREAAARGVRWVLGHQGRDGSFGGDVVHQARVISTLIDVYRLADRLKLNVDRREVLEAIKRGIEWLFGDKAGVTWMEVDGEYGPFWTRDGRPDVRATGDVLRFALLKALWYGIATDVVIETPGGERRLSDLLTDPEYNLHATIRGLLKGQTVKLGPEYGSWGNDAFSTAAAMGALEAYLCPRLYYDEYWKPTRVEVEAEVYDVTSSKTVVVVRCKVPEDAEEVGLSFYEDYGLYGCYEVFHRSWRAKEFVGTLTFEVEGHTYYVVHVVVRYPDGTLDDLFTAAGLRASAAVVREELSPDRKSLMLKEIAETYLLSGGKVGKLRVVGAHVEIRKGGKLVKASDVPVDEKGYFYVVLPVIGDHYYQCPYSVKVPYLKVLWKGREVTVETFSESNAERTPVHVTFGPPKPATEGSKGTRKTTTEREARGVSGGTPERPAQKQPQGRGPSKPSTEERGGVPGASTSAPVRKAEREGGTEKTVETGKASSRVTGTRTAAPTGTKRAVNTAPPSKPRRRLPVWWILPVTSPMALRRLRRRGTAAT